MKKNIQSVSYPPINSSTATLLGLHGKAVAHEDVVHDPKDKACFRRLGLAQALHFKVGVAATQRLSGHHHAQSVFRVCQAPVTVECIIKCLYSVCDDPVTVKCIIS